MFAATQTTASNVLDAAYDLKLERPRITSGEDIDGKVFLLTFGALGSQQQTVEFRPSMTNEQVMEKLVLAAGKLVEPAPAEIAHKPTVVSTEAVNEVKRKVDRLVGVESNYVAAEPAKPKAGAKKRNAIR